MKDAEYNTKTEMFKGNLGSLFFFCFFSIFPLLFVSNNEALFYKIMTTAKHYFR